MVPVKFARLTMCIAWRASADVTKARFPVQDLRRIRRLLAMLSLCGVCG